MTTPQIRPNAATDSPPHKNKTLATLLALLLGGVGAHGFYLRGGKDRWSLLHLVSVLACLSIAVAWPHANSFFKLLPLLVSALIGLLEALVIGLTPDDKWDAAHNAGTGRQSASRWPLVLLLVAALILGASGLIFVITRLVDLLYTGGAYG